MIFEGGSGQCLRGVGDLTRFYGVIEPVWQPDNWLGERLFGEMLAEAGVELWTSMALVEGSDGVVVDPGPPRRIVGLKFAPSSIRTTAGGNSGPGKAVSVSVWLKSCASLVLTL